LLSHFILEALRTTHTAQFCLSIQEFINMCKDMQRKQTMRTYDLLAETGT